MTVVAGAVEVSATAPASVWFDHDLPGSARRGEAMRIGLMVAVVLFVPGCSGAWPLDKTGTSASEIEWVNEKTLENQGFCGGRSSGAERAGFEPTVGVTLRGFSKAVL